MAVLALGAAVVSGCGAEKKSDTSIAELKVNNMNQAPVVDELKSFTWRMESERSGLYQSAYRIVLAQSEAKWIGAKSLEAEGSVSYQDTESFSWKYGRGLTCDYDFLFEGEARGG